MSFRDFDALRRAELEKHPTQLKAITITVQGPHYRVEQGQDVDVKSFNTVYSVKPGGQMIIKNRFIAPRPDYSVREQKRNLAARNPEKYPKKPRRESTGTVRFMDPDPRRRST